MAALDWHALGEINSQPVHYRKWKVYELEETLEIPESMLSGAPYGGPVAVIRNPGKSSGAAATVAEPMEIRIYSSSGVLLAQEPVRALSRVAGMGWSDLETLACVHEDGTCIVYDLFAQAFPPFSLLEGLPQGPAGVKVVEVCVWGAGLVALLSDWRVVSVDQLSLVGAHGRHLQLTGAMADAGGPRLTRVMRTGLSERSRVLSMGVLPPHFTSSGQLEVLLGTNENTVLVCDAEGCEDQQLQESLGAPVVMMSIAPNGRFMACFLANGVLTVMSTSFGNKILDFDTSSTRKPLQMVWCGEDAVLLSWSGFLLMVGPFGHWLQFPYAGVPTHVVPEADGVRVFTPKGCEMLQRVPPATDSIRRIFSTDPAALLYDAMERFEDGDVKADDAVRSLVEEGSVSAAVSSCGSAAVSEFDPEAQKRYLRAAAYGMSAAFMPHSAPPLAASSQDTDLAHSASSSSAPNLPRGSTVDPAEFVACSQKLRVLNQVRGVGLPLTAAQYDRLTPQVLIDRLAQRKEHHLALKLCAFLKLSPVKVLTHWACLKLRSPKSRDLSDAALEKAIVSKVDQHCGRDAMSFASIALAAFDNGRGRVRLATILLDYEKSAADKVKLLLSMDQPEGALWKAVDSLNQDLVFLVLLHLEHSVAASTRGESAEPGGSRAASSGAAQLQAKKRQQELFTLVGTKPEAASLLQLYYSCLADDRLMKFYEYHKNFREAGLLAAVTGYQASFEVMAKAEAQADAAIAVGLSGGRLGGQQYAQQQAAATAAVGAAEALNERLSGLRNAATLFSQNQQKLGFLQKTTEEQGELLVAQAALEKKYGALTGSRVELVDLSVSETMYTLLTMAGDHPTERANLLGEANKLQKQCKVPDKRFWHVKVRALAESGQWDELRKFANEKKSPIGYRPFAERCVEQRLPAEQVSFYIDRMTEPEEKYELYVKVCLWAKALEVAQRQLKDPNKLKQVRALCKDPKVERAVDQIMASGQF